jgi:tRNA-uridine 2-sulfurtransferase
MSANAAVKVYVGMSGGVDSSLTAALLIEQGYDVTGVYMKNWTQDLPGMKCPWADDLADAKRVAVQLGIDFKVFDFENEYKDKVVNYMIDEYKHGRTPNPDIMCNQEVKFKLFLDAALDDGADMIATGHYARVSDGKLLQAVDSNKDQTYFLYRVTGDALTKTLFPLGEFTKPQVREMALERGLYTAGKKDSQGICFVGKVGIRDFLSMYVQQTPGKIIDTQSGKVLGRHDGAIFYTLGQRHGLDVGGGLPYYVVGKDMDKNEVYVTTDLNDGSLWKNTVILASVHWINDAPPSGQYDIRVRHRAKLVQAVLTYDSDGTISLQLVNPERAVAAGQSVVLYDGDTCIGGGIVI